MGWNDFKLPVVGTQFDNEDGTSRQDELRRCRPGEMIQLVREPENPHDPMALAVFSCRGVRVGYMSRRNNWVTSKIDRGQDVRAIVARVQGAQMRDAMLGLIMLLNMDGEEPELA